MTTPLNGHLPRSSIMHGHRLVQACIVLAVGAGLASCAKDQKDHALTQPAHFGQSLKPCPPAGVSSVGTSELCVVVKDIQLLSHEKKADVALSVMNRTGHRIYITLVGSPYLTDSSGKKWDMGDTKGLGGSSNPVPLEADGEGLGTISFHQNGLTPADLTFALHGEIGIFRTDSHGQTVPGQVAIIRRINLSDIRIQRQLPQTTRATEQSKNQKLPQLRARRPDLAASKPPASSKSLGSGEMTGQSENSGKSNSQRLSGPNVGHSPDHRANLLDLPGDDTSTSKSGSKSVGNSETGPDVIGLRIGMTPNQAREMFKLNGFGSSTKSLNRPFDSYAEASNALAVSLPGQAPQPVPHTNYVSRISGAIRDIKSPATENSGSVLSVFFGPVPGHEGMVLLNRTEYLSASKEPTFAAFSKTLVEKYGTPTELVPDSPGVFRWRYDSDGTLRKPSLANNFVGCPRLRAGGVEFQLQGFPATIHEYKQSRSKCGAIFLEVAMGFEGFNYKGSETLVKDYTTHMSGLDATIHALEAAKDIVDKAQAAAGGNAIKKGQQQKPNL